MNDVKISVIVPIYKAELFIERCARSLMEQTMKDGIEFVFINDCTPDNSMQILERVIDDYPERSNQIIIWNNPENFGVTKSRKKGIELSNGEYIGWCVSDDWCEMNMFEKMYNKASDDSSDIIVCNYYEVTEGKNREICIVHTENPQIAIINSIYGRSFSGVLWNQIVKKRIIQKCWNQIIPTNYSEDTYVLFHVYYHSQTIAIIDEPLYNHITDNLESLVHIRDNTKTAWLVQQENLERIERLYYKNNGWSKFHIALNGFIFERKNLYRNAFNSPEDFFYTFRHASRDILRFYDWKKLSTWKIYLAHNCYLLFKLIHKN